MDGKVNWPTSDPLFPKHPTDYNIAKFSLIPGPEERPEIYSEDANDFYSERYLEEVAIRAQLIGGIRLYDLVFIMAKSESHNEVLPELWNYSGFNKSIVEFPKWDSSMGENEWSRAHVWYWLLWRWTIYEKFCGSDERKSYYFAEIAEKCPIPRLNLYKYKSDDKIFEKLDNTKEQTAKQYFKLEEFAKYLKEVIEKRYFKGRLTIPLPGLLFPEISAPLKENGSNIESRDKVILEGDLLPCASGTKWEDVTITLVADNMVEIVGPGISGRYTFHKLGMEDKRKGDKPVAIWALLKLFAKNQGFVSRKNIEYDRRLPDNARLLNKHLKRIFGIEESIYTGHYKKEKGYRTRIEFRDRTH